MTALLGWGCIHGLHGKGGFLTYEAVVGDTAKCTSTQPGCASAGQGWIALENFPSDFTMT